MNPKYKVLSRTQGTRKSFPEFHQALHKTGCAFTGYAVVFLDMQIFGHVGKKSDKKV